MMPTESQAPPWFPLWLPSSLRLQHLGVGVSVRADAAIDDDRDVACARHHVGTSGRQYRALKLFRVQYGELCESRWGAPRFQTPSSVARMCRPRTPAGSMSTCVGWLSLVHPFVNICGLHACKNQGLDHHVRQSAN